MSQLSSEARFCYLSEPNPAKALSKLNDLLTETLSQLDRFVTLGVVLLDPITHSVTMVSAGQSSPVLYRAGQPIKDVMPNSVAGMPLGIIEGIQFDSCQTTLQPGDILVMFTDGVNESKDTNEREFGMEGVEKVLRETGPVGPKELVDRIVKGVKQHALGRLPHDDVTVVAFGRSR